MQLNKAIAVVVEQTNKGSIEYFSHYATMYKKAQYKVQIKIHEPNMTIGKTKVETQELSIGVLQSYTRMSQELLLKLVPLLGGNSNI
eukprot:2952546-Ditylum_brightwellii.AAC.3